jgi:hypothetical protein
MRIVRIYIYIYISITIASGRTRLPLPLMYTFQRSRSIHDSISVTQEHASQKVDTVAIDTVYNIYIYCHQDEHYHDHHCLDNVGSIKENRKATTYGHGTGRT